MRSSMQEIRNRPLNRASPVSSAVEGFLVELDEEFLELVDLLVEVFEEDLEELLDSDSLEDSDLLVDVEVEDSDDEDSDDEASSISVSIFGRASTL